MHLYCLLTSVPDFSDASGAGAEIQAATETASTSQGQSQKPALTSCFVTSASSGPYSAFSGPCGGLLARSDW